MMQRSWIIMKKSWNNHGKVIGNLGKFLENFQQIMKKSCFHSWIKSASNFRNFLVQFVPITLHSAF